MKTLVQTIIIPKYRPGQIPDHEVVGKRLDDLLKQKFIGMKVVIRCIGSQDHNINIDDLADMIVKTGTDKYDPGIIGIGYAEFIYKGIKVDFYGEEIEIKDKLDIMPQQIWEMYHSAIGDRGFGVHVDLVLIYDASQLDMVMNLYKDHPNSDGFTFKNPKEKSAALVGLIKVRGD